MKFATAAIGLFSASLLVASVGAGVAVDGDCSVGSQAMMEEKLEPIEELEESSRNLTANTVPGSSRISRFEAPTPARRLDSVGSEMGEPQDIPAAQQEAIYDKIAEARYYMNNVVALEAKYDEIREGCKNQHSSCAFWAVIGECEKNPGYMKAKCAPVCQSCDYLSVETRCPLDPDAKDALYPGDVTRIFNRIMVDPKIQEFKPKIVSRPDYLYGDNADNADYIIGPWMVVFENAITEEEANRLIELGGIEGYQRSADVGRRLADGTYDKKIYAGRTSTNAWCQNACYEDPIAKRVMERVEYITGIPEPNSEWLQLLRYEQNQHYNRHHDLIGYQKQRQCGVRIFTLYFYLDDVEEGGGTHFPALNLTVTPKRGRAVLWPSVYDHDPNTADPRTEHEAQPVIKGVKYGANAWVHQRDFKTPHRNGCN